jgi:beta-glucanase (GH16 family)
MCALSDGVGHHRRFIRLIRALSALVVTGLLLSSSTGLYGPPAVAESPAAVFDDFNGPSGVAPDPGVWGYDLGPWPDQLQTYTDSSRNVRLDGAGNLVIEARMGQDGVITSGRLVTRGKLDMMYGTLSARVRTPSGQGISPAFWLVGSDIDAVGWPASGEIDIVEMPNTGTYSYTTIHGPWVGAPPAGRPDYKVWTEGATDDLSASFHTFWISRSPYTIVIGVDDRTLATFTPASLKPDQKWVFDRPMYAILNVAVGDSWAGPPDESTTWPATMLVDWMRWLPA